LEVWSSLGFISVDSPKLVSYVAKSRMSSTLSDFACIDFFFISAMLFYVNVYLVSFFSISTVNLSLSAIMLLVCFLIPSITFEGAPIIVEETPFRSLVGEDELL
jgi:hypothetical protein